MARRVERLLCAYGTIRVVTAIHVLLVVTCETRCGVNLHGGHYVVRRLAEATPHIVGVATLRVEEATGEVNVVIPSRLQVRIVHRFLHRVARVANGEQFLEGGAEG